MFHLYRKHCGRALVGWTKMGSVSHPDPAYSEVLRGSPDMIVVLRVMKYDQDGEEIVQDEVKVLEIKTAPRRQIEFEKDDQGNDILSRAIVTPGHWSQLQVGRYILAFQFIAAMLMFYIFLTLTDPYCTCRDTSTCSAWSTATLPSGSPTRWGVRCM